MGSKKRTTILGGVFLTYLALAYFENIFFLGYAKDIFTNPPLALSLVFLHNIIAVSLIIIGMTFYVQFVLTFLPKKEIEGLVFQHPRLFALMFTAIIMLTSILRVSTMLRDQVTINVLSVFMIACLPHGIVEGYGIFRAIHMTLRSTLTMKRLTTIYLVFLLAAVLEVGFVQANVARWLVPKIGLKWSLFPFLDLGAVFCFARVPSLPASSTPLETAEAPL